MRERKSLMKSKWLMPIKTNNRLIDPKLKLNVLRQIEMADGKGGGYLCNYIHKYLFTYQPSYILNYKY